MSSESDSDNDSQSASSSSSSEEEESESVSIEVRQRQQRDYLNSVLQSLLPVHLPNRRRRSYERDSGEFSIRTEHKEDLCPNLKSALQKSEFVQITKMASGLAEPLRKPYPATNISQLMQNRERGYPQSNFSRACKSRINNTYLPNAMKILDYYSAKVFCGIFSKQGQYFLTAVQDRKLRLYDSTRANYKFLRTYKARDVGWSILDVAFSPSEEHFVYSTWSCSLHLCAINKDEDANHKPICLIKTNRRFCIFCVVFSSNGRELLGAANDGTLYIYDLVSQNRVLEIEAHDYDVNTVAFADNNCQIIYSGADDGVVKVWDRRTMNESHPKPVGVLAGHLNGITFIDSRGDGRHLISNSKDQTIKLWDIRVFSSEKAVSKWKIAVNRLGWDYRWQEVPQRMLHNKRQVDDASVMTYQGHSVIKTLIRCRFSPVHTTGQRYIYTGSGNGDLIVYDSLTGNMEMKVEKHRSCTRDVHWHPQRNEILSCSWDGSVGQSTYRDKATDSPENLTSDDSPIKLPRSTIYTRIRQERVELSNLEV